MISHELKNVPERMAAVKYSVATRVFNERLQRGPVAAFNPVIAHKLVHSRAVSGKYVHYRIALSKQGFLPTKQKFRSESPFLALAIR
jgi:hypothetical protein